ncbi:hypothetical protein P691DRAFT_764392 [Macrolepiota fuliginosa MF-IS2]|uniref:Uncharacterized protein n=1 Tax=Macrolepiota fuliginosa MF-IS2 TaxID=1400762 RepID=A0A9P6BWU7_9AGAR|nr:hypothetical protein P691DRAFT_764392 [Macrolepiota fuliginosa MF-IS2]
MPLPTSYEIILAQEQGGERPSTSTPVQHRPAPVPPTRVRDAIGTINDDQATANPSDSVPPTGQSFYRQVLSGVPANILSTTMRILGLVIINHRDLNSANSQAKFLGLDQVAFRRALENLHSVVYVPPVEESNTTPLRIYHASFSDFLDDVGRSGEFHLNREAVKYDFALQCLHWIENDDGPLGDKALVTFSVSRGWDACCGLSDDFVPGLVNRLERFDFSCLRFNHVGSGFASLLRWLHSLGSTRNKSVISVGWGSFRTCPSSNIRWEYQPLSAHEYIASFTPDILAPELPFTLKLRLGTAVRVHITLEVVARDARHANHLHFLGKGCRGIQEKFSDHLPANWPTESNLLRLADLASGNINDAAFLLRFIGDDVLADPDAQLKICMSILPSDRGSSTIESLCPLNPLYHHIFSNIPTDLLPITTRILGFLVFGASCYASADLQARFLGLDPITIRQSLQNLRSIIYIPPQDKFNTTPLYIYRQSCSSFLEANRSSGIRLDMEAVRYDVILQCLHWIENDDQSPSNRDLINFCVSEGWHTCCNLSKDFIPRLISRLGSFDFRCLTHAHIEGPDFGEFIQWLYSVGSTCDKSVITIIPGAPQEGAISNGLRVIYRMSSHFPRDLLMLGKPDPATHIHIASLIPDLVASEILFAMKLRLGDVSQVRVALVVIDDKTGGVLGPLRRGFDAIREKFKPHYPGHWPPESHLLQLALLASGDVGTVSFLLRFIGDELCCDPVGRLRACMRFLDGGRIVASGAIDPSRTLGLLYHSILSGIPPDHLPIATRILRLLNVHHDGFNTVSDQTRFLELDQATFHRSIQGLHSLVYVPPANKCNTISVRIYDHSFSNFLEDSNRSKKFYLDGGAVEYDFALKCLHWIENGAGSPSNEAIFRFSVSNGWGACCNLSDDFIPGLISRLERFDFHRLTNAHVEEVFYRQQLVVCDGFAKFLQWLFSLGSIRNKSLISVMQDTSRASEEIHALVLLKFRLHSSFDSEMPLMCICHLKSMSVPRGLKVTCVTVAGPLDGPRSSERSEQERAGSSIYWM